MCEQALRTLCLREGDDVADGVCTGHHGNDTVETESDTAVRRSTELESVKQEAELLSGFFRTNLQCIEDFALDVCLVDTDRTAADFPAVKNHIVGFG